MLLGGIPRTNTILVEGPIGVGKTTLGVEFIYRRVTRFAEPGVIVLFEMSPAKVRRDALAFGWDLAQLEAQGQLKLIFTTREVLRQELQDSDSLLLEQIQAMGAQRIFLDGVARLPGREGQSAGTAAAETRSSFHWMAEAWARAEVSAMIAVEASLSGDDNLLLAERAIADTVIRLERVDNNRATTRSLQIVKSRGQDYLMGEHSFQIMDGSGLQVYRRVQAPRPKRDQALRRPPGERAATGTVGMDEMVNGGYLHGSTTVISGTSGSGKSVLGLQYLAEGARRGERSLMLSLDEHTPQIQRNAASIGLDLAGDMAKGLTRIEYQPPQEIQVDAHFYTIETTIKEFRPKRVVVDSLSTYGSALGTGGRLFRDFFHALVSLMREYEIAAVYNHEVAQILGMETMTGEFSLSSMVDNIVLMNWIELGDQFRLGMTVAKMRANPVSRITRECEIVSGRGLYVLPRIMPVAVSPAPFSSYAGLVSRAPARRRIRQAEGEQDDAA